MRISERVRIDVCRVLIMVAQQRSHQLVCAQLRIRVGLI